MRRAQCKAEALKCGLFFFDAVALRITFPGSLKVTHYTWCDSGPGNSLFQLTVCGEQPAPTHEIEPMYQKSDWLAIGRLDHTQHTLYRIFVGAPVDVETPHRCV